MRLWIAVILFLVSLLAVLPAQTYLHWKASIVGSELGHWVALASLIVLLIPWWWTTVRGQLAGALAVVAFCLSISPSVRAWRAGSGLGDSVDVIFGKSHPRSLPGASPVSSPYSLLRVARMPGSPEVSMTTLTYVKRGDDEPLALDVYRRNRNLPPAPLVIVVHGGSWIAGSRSELPALNSYLASRGYVVATVTYRLAPANPFPAQTQDLNAAIDYLKQHAGSLGIDSTRIALVGRSAGGQIVLMSAYTKQDSAIRGVVSLYGPTDQQWGWENPANPSVYDSYATLRTFLHGEPSEIPQAYRASSPINFVGPATVPTLLIHGAMDPLVSSRQSERLDSALAAAHRPHLLVKLPWATHACDYFFTGPCGQVSTFAIERFLGSLFPVS
jgi:acetyl esterase/lipase